MSNGNENLMVQERFCPRCAVNLYVPVRFGLSCPECGNLLFPPDRKFSVSVESRERYIRKYFPHGANVDGSPATVDETAVISDRASLFATE